MAKQHPITRVQQICMHINFRSPISVSTTVWCNAICPEYCCYCTAKGQKTGVMCTCTSNQWSKFEEVKEVIEWAKREVVWMRSVSIKNSTAYKWSSPGLWKVNFYLPGFCLCLHPVYCQTCVAYVSWGNNKRNYIKGCVLCYFQKESVDAFHYHFQATNW